MPTLTAIDLFGFAAATATLVAFAQATPTPMRLAAITANVCFISYGTLGLYWSVLALHVILLPINLYRLVEHLRRDDRRREERADQDAGATARPPPIAPRFLTQHPAVPHVRPSTTPSLT